MTIGGDVREGPDDGTTLFRKATLPIFRGLHKFGYFLVMRRPHSDVWSGIPVFRLVGFAP